MVDVEILFYQLSHETKVKMLMCGTLLETFNGWCIILVSTAPFNKLMLSFRGSLSPHSYHPKLIIRWSTLKYFFISFYFLCGTWTFNGWCIKLGRNPIHYPKLIIPIFYFSWTINISVLSTTKSQSLTTTLVASIRNHCSTLMCFEIEVS